MDELEANVREEALNADWLPEDPTHEDFCDAAHELADSSVPVYTSDLMRLAAEDTDLATSEPSLGPAFDGRPTPVNIIAANVYERLYDVAYATLHERFKVEG